ncbi:MAG: S1 family peptidase [Candidatus Hodarchaeales archaeon]
MSRTNIDTVSYSTTIIWQYISGKSGEDSFIGSATGFFLKIKSRTWLITNRHVVINEDNQFYPDRLSILVHTNAENHNDNEEINIDLYENGKQVWKNFAYEEGLRDVVAIDLSNKIYTNINLINAYTKNNLPSKDQNIDVGENVLIVGYPVGFYDKINNFPIIKSGTIASTYGLEFNDNPYFLIDANLHPGTSGSPVLIKSKKVKKESIDKQNDIPYTLIGIVSGDHKPMGISVELNKVWYLDEIIKGLNMFSK